MRTRLYAASAAIFLVGVTAGILIYLLADDEAANLAIHEMQISKTYVRELQRFGGKAAVIFDEFNRWFAGLWQGKSLGVTIGWLSVFASAVVFLVARRLDRG
jgi:hypothetical protein